MNRQPVESSNIRSVGFENGTMHIEFSNGRIYAYTGPKVEEHFRGLMAAGSKGGYFAKHIRHCKETKCESV